MADNVQISDNPIIAADVIDGVTHQRVKAQWGADGTANDTSAANPMPVIDSSTAASAYTIASTVETVGTEPAVTVSILDGFGSRVSLSPPSRVTVTPTLSTTPAYTANDSMSTDDLEFVGAGPSGIITGVTIVEKGDQTHDGTNGHVIVDVFTGAVTPGTANGAYALASDTEAAKYIGSMDTRYGGADGAGTWRDVGPSKVIFVPAFIPYETDDEDTIFAALIAARTWSAVAGASDLDITLHFARD